MNPHELQPQELTCPRRKDLLIKRIVTVLAPEELHGGMILTFASTPP